jgi:2-methylcitrate dehydratase PrpD
MSSPEPTRRLAEFVAGLRVDAIPPAVRDRVVDLLIDAVASGLAGWHGDETAQIQALANAVGGPGDSPVIGGQPLTAAGAALLNGYLITALTVCDVYRPALCHVTPEVVPPAIAIAQRVGASGAELLTALAAGLETTVRVGLGTDYPVFRARGWHSPGVIGPFGGAAAAGSLLGLDAGGQRHALGLAGSQSAGTFAHWGTATIKFNQSRGALSGLLAALLAEQDFRASDEVLDHPDGGIFHAYAEGGRPDAVVEGLGERWELERISLRLWPLASSLQSVATALFALIEAHDVRPAAAEEVVVRLSGTVFDMHGTLPWDVRFRALLSAPYATAVILHDRRCWVEQFSQERISDPALGAFARDRVRVVRDPELSGTAATVEVRLAGGQVLREHREVPRGDADDPLTRAEIEAKFRSAAAGVLEEPAAEELLGALGELERLPNVRPLLAGLRPRAPVR